MNGLELAAIFVPSGAAYGVVTLFTARATYRTLDPEKVGDGDVWTSFVIGLLWPIVLPLVGIYKFITAVEKQ